MSTRALVLAVVGAGCVAAAGTGGYIALRTNSTERATGRASTAASADATPAAKGAPASTDRVAGATASAASRPAGAKSPKPVDPPARTTQAARPSAPPPLESTGVVMPPATPPVTADPPVTDPVPPPPPPVIDVPPPAQDPPKKFEELTVREESVIGIRLDAAISSATAKVEDKVTAQVTRDVTVAGHVAIPSGARLDGVVTSVERGGKFKNPGRLGIRFTTLVLADKTRVPITTEALTRIAESPGNEATAKVGASAVVGGLIGALIGGKKGAAIGAGAGAAGGAAAVAAGDRNDVVLPAGAAMTVKLTAPVTLLIERDQF